MVKRTLGAVVKGARDGARMTQRELAAAIGVKASHIAYIENGHRKPSISLINRLGETLGLNTKELLVLAHPDAKQIVDSARPSTKKGDAAWPRFVSNQALLRRHAITKSELKILEQVAMLENVAHPGHFIFILNAIRQAAVQL
jgi:transcriptional regulator with XRE-family HTH domain